MQTKSHSISTRPRARFLTKFASSCKIFFRVSVSFFFGAPIHRHEKKHGAKDFAYFKLSRATASGWRFFLHRKNTTRTLDGDSFCKIEKEGEAFWCFVLLFATNKKPPQVVFVWPPRKRETLTIILIVCVFFLLGTGGRGGLPPQVSHIVSITCYTHKSDWYFAPQCEISFLFCKVATCSNRAKEKITEGSVCKYGTLWKIHPRSIIYATWPR